MIRADIFLDRYRYLPVLKAAIQGFVSSEVKKLYRDIPT